MAKMGSALLGFLFFLFYDISTVSSCSGSRDVFIRLSE